MTRWARRRATGATRGGSPTPGRALIRCAAGAASALALAMSLSCAPERERLGPPEPAGGEFTLGPVTEYPVPAEAGQALADSISGGEFVFPEGGAGTLKVARIVESPLPGPEGAEGFSVEYDGYDRIELRLGRPEGSVPLLYIYGFGDVSPAEPLASEDPNTWWPVMPEDTLSNPAVFRLVEPGIPDYTPSANEPLAPNGTRGPRGLAAPGASAEEATQSYRFMRRVIEKDRQEWTNLVNLRLITQWTVRDVIAALPDGLKDFATSETSDRLAFRSYAALPSPNVSSYSAFQHYRTYLGPPYRRLYPMMSYVCTGNDLATEATVAHEVGHYFTHVFFGDDAFEAFYRAQLVTNHDIGSYHSQRPMLEEFAMYVDYFKNGDVRGGAKVDDPFSLYPMAPSVVDFPAQEGYATCLLAVMHTGGDKILNQTHLEYEDIPVIAMPHADVFEILYTHKPTNVNQLRAELELYLAGKNMLDRFPAVLERTGWSYHGYGRVVDKDARPLVGATVQSVCKVLSGGEREYLAPLEPVTTDNDGRFTLPRLFPGLNTIRVKHGSIEQDFPYTIDPNSRTDFSHNLGLLALQETAMNALRRMKRMGIYCEGTFTRDDSSKTDKLLQSGYLSLHNGQWTGNEFRVLFSDSTVSTSGRTTREDVDCTVRFSADGSMVENLQCTIHGTTRFSGVLVNSSTSTIDIDDLPLTILNTEEPGYYNAYFDLRTNEIGPNLRSISQVENIYNNPLPTVTHAYVGFDWTDPASPGHVGIVLTEWASTKDGQ